MNLSLGISLVFLFSTSLVISCPSIQVENSIITNLFTANLNCDLVPTNIRGNETRGLSSFWAQEYTGADLVRKRIADLNILNVPRDLYEVCDSKQTPGNRPHGEPASSLVGSPYGVIGLSEPKDIINIKHAGDIQRGERDFLGGDQAEAVLEDFLFKINNCISQKKPNYINNSMSWPNSDEIFETFNRLKNQSGDDFPVFITSAGNTNTPLGHQKRRLLENDLALVVTSTDTNGDPSSYTNFGAGSTISAPAGNEMTAMSEGKPYTFSGTSGATPLVTGALAAFTLISGRKLNTTEAKELLRKTALPYISYPSPNSLGHGNLNAYMMSEIAIQMRAQCHHLGEGEKKGCEEAILRDPKSSIRSNQEEQLNLLSEFNRLYSEESCQGNTVLLDETCEQRKVLYENLRKMALLNPENINIWKTLGCMSNAHGLNKNADYYHSMAARVSKTDSQLIDQLIADDKEFELFNYLLSHPEQNKENEVTISLLEKDKFLENLIVFELKKEKYLKVENRPIFEKLLAKKNDQLNILLMENIFTNTKKLRNHLDILELILFSGSDDLQKYFFNNHLMRLSPTDPQHMNFVRKYKNHFRKNRTVKNFFREERFKLWSEKN